MPLRGGDVVQRRDQVAGIGGEPRDDGVLAQFADSVRRAFSPRGGRWRGGTSS